MAKKKRVETKWKPTSSRVLLRAVKNIDSKILITKGISEMAKNMYEFYVEAIGEKVPDYLVKGTKVYISLPGLVSIEGTTDMDAEETFFFIDYNFIYLYGK